MYYCVVDFIFKRKLHKICHLFKELSSLKKKKILLKDFSKYEALLELFSCVRVKQRFVGFGRANYTSGSLKTFDVIMQQI